MNKIQELIEAVQRAHHASKQVFMDNSQQRVWVEQIDLAASLCVEANNELKQLEAGQWTPVASGMTVDCQCDACHGKILVGDGSVTMTDNHDRRHTMTILLPDNVRFCVR